MPELLKLCNSCSYLITNKRGICTRVSWGALSPEGPVELFGQLFSAGYLPVGQSKLVQNHFCIFSLSVLEYVLNQLKIY